MLIPWTGWTIRSLALKRTLRRACNSIAEPGHIVASYETYALVRDIVAAHALPPITMKGINREVVPYEVDGMLDAAGQKIRILQRSI